MLSGFVCIVTSCSKFAYDTSFLPSCLALAICTNCSKLALAKFWHHFPKPGKSFRTSWGTPRRHQGGRGLRASISSLCCNMWCTLHSIFYWIAILCRVYLCLKGFVSFLRRWLDTGNMQHFSEKCALLSVKFHVPITHSPSGYSLDAVRGYMNPV